MSKAGEKVNQFGLANLFGVHRNTVQAWVRKGCPYVTKGDRRKGIEWEFDTAEVLQWKIEEAISDVEADTETANEAELNRRKLAAETTIAELKAGQARGELGSIQEFRRQVAGAIIELRQRLLQIPTRVEPGDSEKRGIIEDEILQALNDIADGIESDSDDE